MMTPLVSVIIPTYNNGTFIGDALDSALRQTYGNIEVIVVDDGSNDNTRDAITGYEKEIRYLYQSNQGPAVARNTGIRNSRGEFIAFLDADDIWLPEKIAIQIAEIQGSSMNPGMVYTQYLNFVDGSEDRKLLPTGIRSGDLFELLLFENIILLSSVMIRRDVISNIGAFDESLVTAEDTNLWLRIARTYRILGIEKALVHRRIHKGNFSDRFDVNVGTLHNLDKFIADRTFRAAEQKLLRKAYLHKGKKLLADSFHAGAYSMSHEAAGKILRVYPYDASVYFYRIVTSMPEAWIKSCRRIARYLRRIA